MIFGKDIVAWSLESDGQDYKVREIHLLKDRTLMRGPWVFESFWKRDQRRMQKPYPESLRKPIDVIYQEAE